MRATIGRRGLLWSASLGALVWSAYAVRRGGFGLDALFLAAPLVLVPLSLALIAREDRRGTLPRLSALAAWLQPPAALLMVGSFLTAPGPLAAALAAPWLALTVVLALHGVARLLARGAGPAEELAVDAGLAYAAVGGAWLFASRAGIEPLGFHEPVILLTAVHFHVAAFALLAFAGALGRAMLPGPREREYRLVVATLVAGPFLLALGITFSRPLEIGASLVMAIGVLGILALATRWRPRFVPLALAAIVSMTLAVLFATGGVPIPTMARFHGTVNVAILVSGLTMLLFLPSRPRAPRAGIPFSALRSRRRTGPDYFEREKLAEARAARPTGLLDDLAAYARPDFDPARVAPPIRAFYERTEEYALLVVPRWRRGFRVLGRLYGIYAVAVGQMCFPMDEASAGQRVRSVIVAVRAAADGRENVRAWVRTYADTGRPAYVAAYATHTEGGQTYMNIAFPFPGWNLTSVLRMESFGVSGVLLTSRAAPMTWGDQGVYAVGQRFRMRLPINETISVWTDDGETVLARHEMSFAGARFLTLDYRIERSAGRNGLPVD